MDQSKRPRQKIDPASRLASRRARPDAAFDLWLQRGLHQMFDEVTREPIPEELLRLIEQDRKE
jgi:hypothetical protein